MSAKAEIGWRRTAEDGQVYHVYARRFGAAWRFFERQRRYELWRALESPGLEDWLELLASVRRRVRRRLLTPADADRLRQRIRELFPEAMVDE